MRHEWQLREAESRFIELVDRAVSDGPQVVTHGGKRVVVVVSCDDYKRKELRDESLVDFLRNSPLWGLELDRNW